MSKTIKKQRIKMKLKHPNPLFEQWLSEWLNEAKSSDSKMQYCFSKALSSLRKYPLPLNKGSDCSILTGFGEKLCKMLDKKLSQHSIPLDTTLDFQPAAFKPESPVKTTKVKPKPRVTKQKETPKENKGYSPAINSGAYAILVTLYKASLDAGYKGFMSKVDLIRDGQCLSDKSFTKCDQGSYYNAWSSMGTLIEKSLVEKQGNPARFSLTDTGLVLAHKLYKVYLEKSSSNNNFAISLPQSSTDNTALTNISDNIPSTSYLSSNIILSDNAGDLVPVNASKQPKKAKKMPRTTSSTSTKSTTSSASSVAFEEFTLHPDSFEIILLVDTAETVGAKKDIRDDPLLNALTHQQLPFEVRHLTVGDYTWIARARSSTNSTTVIKEPSRARELVLPYIVERKRTDDLAHSIKDGRYHEQKFRLRKCSLEHVIYLVESMGVCGDNNTGLPLSTLSQAVTNTLVHDGFLVQYVDGVQGAVRYLGNLTRIIGDLYKNKSLTSSTKEKILPIKINDYQVPLMTFHEFNKASAKNKVLSVKQLFVRQLLQLNGLSIDKALAIVENYETPFLLYMAYIGTSVKEGEALLANIRYGDNNKTIGNAISKTIYQLCTFEKY